MTVWQLYSTVKQQRPFAGISAIMLVLLIALASGAARTQTVVTPGDALDMAQAGQVTIIDIRRPDEWHATGIPTGAKRATVRFSRGVSKFLRRIAALTGGDKTQPIALICAAGVRSKHAARLLKGRGYTQVLDISEGMQGNHRGAGWLRKDLPVSPPVSPCADCP